ncbi:hypothetical protein BBJ28_00004780 [Nothophytophthora sp. Chile5]|nr:hypothetical protein BBJ28_00004780 [Nothophytophthora sp. Chile5]
MSSFRAPSQGAEHPADEKLKASDVDPPENKLEEASPTLEITLIPRRLAFYVGALSIFIAAFTGVALWGITVRKNVIDKVGSSEVADDLTDTYNFRSGLFMALVEVIVGWWLEKFMPVFSVYLHNVLWSTKEFSTKRTMVRRIRAAILFALPMIVVLTLGNSIRGFQASNSTVGFNSTMILDDFKKSQSVLETIKTAALNNSVVESTIMKNALRMKSTPFSFIVNSTCTQQNSSLLYSGQRFAPMNVDDLASIATIYGFNPQEWNAEFNLTKMPGKVNYSITAADAQGDLSWPEDFDTYDMLMLFLHGISMVERAVGNAEKLQHDCSLSDGRYDLDNSSSQGDEYNIDLSLTGDTGQWTYDDDGTRICRGPATALFDLFNYIEQSVDGSIETFVNLVTVGVNKSFPDAFALEETTLSMEKFNLTSQMSLESMTIDLVVNTSVTYGLIPDDVQCTFFNECNATSSSSSTSASDTLDDYVWSYFSTDFCSNTTCAFFDTSESFKLQKEVGMIPFVENCSGISYDVNYGGWFLAECDQIANRAVLYGIGSYISGDEYAYGGMPTLDDVYYGPYIVNPRRHVQFSFAVLSWSTEQLHEVFDAQCDVAADDGECLGMWYQLPQTKRYLFIGEDVLPIEEIKSADFHSPIPLVQLNTPSLLIQGTPVELEYLNLDDFAVTQWDASQNQNLSGQWCSSLMESYLHQVEDNNYFLQRPADVMYTSAFFYFMQDAVVTEVNDTSAIGNTTFSDLLGNVKLKGDVQRRRVVLSIPWNSFLISLLGCIILVVLMAIVLLFPTQQRAEYFPSDTTNAQKYMALKNDEEYPNHVYTKMLVPPSVDQPYAIMDELEVEAMTLVNHADGGRTVEL